MYNLSVHYNNLYDYLCSIITNPRVVYLHPFGSTQPENTEFLRKNFDEIASNPYFPEARGPVFIFYDQEPLDADYNRNLFEYLVKKEPGPFVLVNTEKHSQDKERICKEFPFAHLDYFFHIFAAADWYRGHEYVPGIVPPEQRTLNKTYITFNRLTSNRRVYRSLLINELYKNDLLSSGHVSYSKTCPDGGAFDDNLRAGVPEYSIDSHLVEEAISNIHKLPELRIDFADYEHIPNQSMVLNPVEQLMQSFVFLVTETCYFQNKTHLTEKIFKPIVLRMPFLLLGCAHNLEYLRGYGFQTFGDFWNEDYDTIEDPVLRLQAVVKILKDISTLSRDQQKQMLMDMRPILEHNYRVFTTQSVAQEWAHLTQSLREICQHYDYRPPYRLDPWTKQAIPI